MEFEVSYEYYRSYMPVYAGIDWHAKWLANNRELQSPVHCVYLSENGLVARTELTQENCQIYKNYDNPDLDLILIKTGSNNNHTIKFDDDNYFDGNLVEWQSELTNSEHNCITILSSDIGNDEFNTILDIIGQESELFVTNYPAIHLEETDGCNNVFLNDHAITNHLYINDTDEDFDVLMQSDPQGRCSDVQICRPQIGKDLFERYLEEIGNSNETMVVHTRYPLKHCVDFVLSVLQKDLINLKTLADFHSND